MPTFARGAKPTPSHVMLAAPPHVPVTVAPPQFAAVPSKLSMWNNNQYGICCTAEEAFAKAAWSVRCGLPETFVTDAEVLRWATKYGYRDGAYLTEVMDAMGRDGLAVGGTNYKDGPYKAVDYSNEAVLQNAIFSGPVKVGMDADALPAGAGNQQGWYAVGGSPGQFRNEDHCTGFCGYGPAEFLYQQLYAAGLVSNPAVPSAIRGKAGYLFFTWSTIGFVDHAWVMSTVQETWVRTPTTPGQSPAPDPPPVPPIPATVTVTGQVQPVTVRIPPQTISVPVGGLFGGTRQVTIPAQTITVPGQSVTSTG